MMPTVRKVGRPQVARYSGEALVRETTKLATDEVVKLIMDGGMSEDEARRFVERNLDDLKNDAKPLKDDIKGEEIGRALFDAIDQIQQYVAERLGHDGHVVNRLAGILGWLPKDWKQRRAWAGFERLPKGFRWATELSTFLYEHDRDHRWWWKGSPSDKDLALLSVLAGFLERTTRRMRPRELLKRQTSIVSKARADIANKRTSVVS
jgi:hypothetical protein